MIAIAIIIVESGYAVLTRVGIALVGRIIAAMAIVVVGWGYNTGVGIKFVRSGYAIIIIGTELGANLIAVVIVVVSSSATTGGSSGMT